MLIVNVVINLGREDDYVTHVPASISRTSVWMNSDEEAISFLVKLTIRSPALRVILPRLGT